jgi:hypothetical protein
LCLAALLSFAASAWGQAVPARAADPLAGGGAIVGVGNLRLQSQRLAKLYQQAGLGVNAPVAMCQLGTKGAGGKGSQNVASISEWIQETLAAVTARYALDFAGAAGKVR